MKKIALAMLATLALTGCEDLPAGDKTTPEYWSDLFLNIYADELIVGELEEGPAPLEEPRTVLLITGVTIRAEWFDPIVARLERDGFKPVVYEPPALLSGSLFQASQDLADVVEQVRADSGQDKIDILAECTGGLIARHYVQSLGGEQSVSRLVTFVSPQHGIAKAPWAETIVGWPALTDLSPGSAFLHAVNDAPLPSTVPITSIYTCSDEYIKPYETSIIPGAKNIGLCDEFVGHFQTFYDPEIYLIMHAALMEPTGFEAEPAAPEAEPMETAPETAENTDGELDPESAGDSTPDPVADEVPNGDSEVADEGTAGDWEPVASAEPNAEGAPILAPPSQAPTQPLFIGGGQPQAVGCSSGAGPTSGMALLALVSGLLLVRRRRVLAPLTSGANRTNVHSV